MPRPIKANDANVHSRPALPKTKAIRFLHRFGLEYLLYTHNSLMEYPVTQPATWLNLPLICMLYHASAFHSEYACCS